MMRRIVSDDTGAGAVLAVGIGGAVVLVAVSLLATVPLVAAATRAAVAADLAALAAADTVFGRIPGDACGHAEQVADAHDATIARCEPDAAVTTVAVTVRLGPLALAATAAAGPPPA